MTQPLLVRTGIHPRPSSRRMGAWLQIDGSLSARLASVSGHLAVRVLRQGPVRLQPAEAERLGCPAGAAAHGREVILLADGVPVVFARSVLQAVHARGTWKAIRGLGNRALADLLFGLPAAHRSRFEFARFAPGSGIASTVHRRWHEATGGDRRRMGTARGLGTLLGLHAAWRAAARHGVLRACDPAARGTQARPRDALAALKARRRSG
jgi:chorismate--pyruvate lyase